MPRPLFSCSKVVPLLAAILLVACGEPLTAPVPEATAPIKLAPFVPNSVILPPDPSPAFSLPINPADLAGSFSFREPLSGSAKDDKSKFDRSLLALLAVKVCPAAPAACTAPLATITSAGARDDDLKRDGDQQYKANWKPAKNASGGMVRISVQVAGLEIGSTTVASDGRSIPIKFWVNNNAVIRVRALHAQNIDATKVAQTLVDEFSLNTTQVATRLFSDPAPFPATEVAAALHSSTLNATPEQTGTVYRTMGVPAYQTGTALLGLVNTPDPAQGSESVARWLKFSGYDITAIAPTVSSIFQLGDEGTAQLLHLIGYEAGPIGGVLHEVFHAADVGVATIMKGLGFDAPTVLDVLLKFRPGGVSELEAIGLSLYLAGYGAFEIADALENETFIGARELAIIMKGIGVGANEIAKILNLVNHATMIAATEILKQVGLTPEDVAGALKSAYGPTAEALTVAFHGAGYAASEVVNALRSAYDVSAINAIIALTNGGYAAGQIADGLESGYNFTAAQTAVALQGAGWTAQQAADGLKTAYNLTGEQVAVALNGAGYAANQVAGALKDVYGLTASQVTTIFADALDLGSDAIGTALGAAGYAASEVGSALEDFFGGIGDDIRDGLCSIGICF